MSDDQAFVESILANPNDETTRLVYADWLEERNDPRGEFLRLDSAMISMRVGTPQYERARERLVELRKDIDSKWARYVAFRQIASIETLIQFLREFHRYWMENPVLVWEKIRSELPYGLTALYRELGGLFELDLGGSRYPFYAQDQLSGPNYLKQVDGMIDFAWENSGNWSCRFPLGLEDPPVYSDAADLWDSPAKGFQQVCDSLNHFLITLTLQEAVLSSPCLLSLHGSVSLDNVIDCRMHPLRLKGRYVHLDDSLHDFYFSPQHDVIAMNWERPSIGSHSENVRGLIKPGVELQQIW